MNKKILAVAAAAGAFAGMADTGLYMVVDIAGGKPENAFRCNVEYLSAAPEKGWTDEYKTNKIVLRRIEPGEFTMGSPEAEETRYSNETPRKVKLTKPFYIGIFEITRRQYELVAGKPARPQPAGGDTHPAELVSWEDAAAFCAKLRVGTGLAGFSLPTEAQWEYSCRARERGMPIYGGGAGAKGQLEGTAEDAKLNGIAKTFCNMGLAWKIEDAALSAAGSYAPNGWGLYDMHGNVWEWCRDWYGPYSAAGDIDPDGAVDGEFRVIRGGSAFSWACRSRSAWRGKGYPELRVRGGGFRLVCEAQ